jgi:hypothetical protein
MKVKPSDIDMVYWGDRPNYADAKIPIVNGDQTCYPDVTMTWNDIFVAMSRGTQDKITKQVQAITSGYRMAAGNPPKVNFEFRVRNWLMDYENHAEFLVAIDIRTPLQQEILDLTNRFDELRRDVAELRRD